MKPRDPHESKSQVVPQNRLTVGSPLRSSDGSLQGSLTRTGASACAHGAQERARKGMPGAHLASESANIPKSSHITGDNDPHVTVYQDSSSHLHVTADNVQNKNLSPAVRSPEARVAVPRRAGPSMIMP